MVKEVYAQAPPRQMVRAVARSKGATAKLLRLTRQLEAARRPPKGAARAVQSEVLPSEAKS